MSAQLSHDPWGYDPDRITRHWAPTVLEQSRGTAHPFKPASYAAPHELATGAFLEMRRMRGLTIVCSVDTGREHGPEERPWVARDARTNRVLCQPTTRSRAIEYVRGYCAAAYATPILDDGLEYSTSQDSVSL